MRSCDCEYNLELIVRVMFGNFTKIVRAAGASPIWQNFQTSRVLVIPNCTNNIARLFVYYWHEKIEHLNVKFWGALSSSSGRQFSMSGPHSPSKIEILCFCSLVLLLSVHLGQFSSCLSGFPPFCFSPFCLFWQNH